MKILFIGGTMNYYIGDMVKVRKSDNTTGKVEIDVPAWKGNQLLKDFPKDFIPVPEIQVELKPIPEVKKEVVGSPVKDKIKPEIRPKSKRKKGGKI